MKVKKSLSLFLVFIAILFASCSNWMKDDNLFSDIENDVKVANAAKINVYVRYAMTRQGKTDPEGSAVFKVEIPHEISATTETEYGFVRWAAFTTDFLATGDNQSKNKDFLYVDEEDYNARFLEHEIKAPTVVFEDPYSPTTKVTINEKRDDLFLVPIVEQRPAVGLTIPARGSNGVVRNMSVRISFTKPMDEASFKNAEGVFDTITVTQGTQSFTSEGDIEIDSQDITSRFKDPVFSTNKKMITLTFKDEELSEGYAPQSSVTITISKEVKDLNGFTMVDDEKISFTVGSNMDTLAPRITALTGGIGNAFAAFQGMYKDASDKDLGTKIKLYGSSKASASTIGGQPNTINNAWYNDLVTNRVGNKLVFRVYAQDIAGSGEGQDTQNAIETDVSLIGIRATLLYDKDGEPVSDFQTSMVSYGYVPQSNNTSLTGSYKELVTKSYELTNINENDQLSSTYGALFEYDLSDIPDGLVQINVAAVDLVGNSGLGSGGDYSDEYGNGYATLFVVKDTTPPAATEASKIKSKSTAAPYFWYSPVTLNTMELFDEAGNQIIDTGHVRLNSSPKTTSSHADKLFWSFVVGKDVAAPLSTSDSWKPIHDQNTGASIKYTLDNAQASKDGPVDITLFLRDDIGNVSTPVLLDSIMYDGTNPTVTLRSNYGDFVANDGSLVQHNSKIQNITQILKVQFTEPNEENAGSGVRRIEIHVKKGDEEVTTPLTDNFKVVYAPASIENPTPTSDGVRELSLVAETGVTTNNVKVFNVDDSSKVTTGTLFIYGLHIGGHGDGKYSVKVDLYDSALNKTPVTAQTLISYDTTDPIINKVKVVGAKARTVYGQTETTWWLPSSMLDADKNLTKASFQIEADEAGSGLRTIKLAEDIEFTADSKLKKDGVELEKGTDYTLDVSTNTITMLDSYNAKLSNPAASNFFEITLENVKLKNVNNSNGNKAAVTIEDFVEHSRNNSNTVYYNDTTTTGTLIFADNTPPSIDTSSTGLLKLEDSEKNLTNNPDSIAYDQGNYTDKNTVTLSLKLNKESDSNGSGVKTIHLSDNAVFTDTTAIYVDGTALAAGSFTFAEDKKSVDFAKVFTEANVIKMTNVKLLNETEGVQSVNVDLTDLVGLKTTATSTTNDITYDKTEPDVSKIEWVDPKTGATLGKEKDMTVDTQTLKVEFTDATAGVKVIKFNIHLDDSNEMFTDPFSDTNFKLTYNGTVLTKGTDYTINTKKQYIVLANTYTSGTFKFDNIQLTDANTQGTYVVDVVLLDAAENKINCQETIGIDNIAPVIVGNIIVPNTIQTIELTTSSGSPLIPNVENGTGTFWIKQDYVNGTNKAADAIPVYINVEEGGTGVKVVKFSGNAKLSTSTTIKKIASNGTATQFESNQYDVDTENNTITIRSKNDALKEKNAQEQPVQFKIYVENVGFQKADSETAAAKNIISATVSDVAMNESSSATTAEPSIYSDSRAPAAPENFKLVDRRSTSDTIKASDDYTNESIVNMEFKLTESERYGSGYQSFTIDGATFTNTTKISMKTTSGSNDIVWKYDNEGTPTSSTELPFVLSTDKKTLTLKSGSQNYVVRQKVIVTITDVQLDNAVNGQEKTVSLNVYDLVGRVSAAASDSIWYDNEKPVFEKIFTANYTSTSVPYYMPSVNVYPHTNETGVILEGTNYPTFYTATTATSGYKQYNGQVSSSSSSLAQSTVPYNAVLGIRAKDNLSLGGYVRPKTFLYYVADDTDSKADILAGTNLDTDINDARAITTTGNSKLSAALNFPFATGYYSAVIVDEAGNVSEPFHFAVVKDTEKPSVDGFQNRVLLQKPEDANIYRSAEQSIVDGTCEPRGEGSANTGISFKATKYVTKKSENKYKIILNLGPTYASSNSITKINSNDAPGTTTTYGEFTAQSNNSPIERFAISTWYGAWPDGEHYTYNPSIPYATYLPDGTDAKEANPESNALNPDPTVAKIREYFGFSSSFVGAYRAAQGKTSWHKYKAGESYTDDGNGIVSSIDANNNLIIEIPNTTNTAPISVFLRDGCGNMDYVVLGMQNYDYNVTTTNDEGVSSTTTVHSKTAPCFIVDNKLGWKQTTNGENKEPIIMQNPHMYYASSGANVKWPYTNVSSSAGFKWDYNSGNGTQGGVGGQIGFVKDDVKKATYYNPNINNSTQTVTSGQEIKLGLTLNFKESDTSATYQEDVLFAGTVGKTTDSSNYSTRALIYCSNISTKPSYSDIVGSPLLSEVVQGETYTGFRTDWTAITISNEAASGATLLLDYPQPDYDKLGWTVYDSSKHEPVPHYMWYLYEDRVGNYEIGKVVNSSESDRAVLAGTKTSTTVYDKWLFDGKKPVVTVKDTTKTPENISTADDVKQLIPANNGYVPYLDSTNSRIWVSTNTTDSAIVKRADSLITAPEGWGVTNKVDYQSSYIEARTWLPYFDLDVSNEITGIRAFAWSTSSSYPSTSTPPLSDGNTQGDYSPTRWYAGFGITTIKDIGTDYLYADNPVNAYMDNISTGATYKGKYSGTKINTVIPQNRISTSSDTTLYLHIMDWTGNIQTYQIGKDASLQFRNDNTIPEWHGSNNTDTNGAPSEYFINVENGDLTIRIAGNGKGSDDRTTGQQTMYVEFPSSYYSDDSGVAGFVLNDGTILTLDKVEKDNSGNYRTVLKIPYSVYKDWPDTGNWTEQNGWVHFTAFDNVGNYWDDCRFKAYNDKTPPVIDCVTLVINKSTGNVNKFADPDFGLGTNEANYNVFDCYRDYHPKIKTGEETGYNLYQDTLSKVPTEVIQEVYINNTSIAKFHINLKAATPDLNDVIINKWNATSGEWEHFTSILDNNNIGWSYGTKTSEITFKTGSGSDPNANGYVLTYDANGTYYQIVVTDLSGNTSCQYFKLILDKQGPELVARTDSTSKTPTVELGKGSINGWPLNNPSTYYYTAASGKELKINFAMKDAGVKNSKQIFWYSFDPAVVASTPDESKWIEITPSDDGATNVTAKITSGDIEKIYFKDLLGNISTLTPGSGANADFEGYKYSYGSNSKTMTKLTYWDKTPNAPEISVGDSGNVQTSAAYDNNDWDKTHVKQSDDYDTDHTIIITSQDRRQLKVSFTKPEDENIIGYLVTDESGNFINNSEYFDSENQYASQAKQQRVLDTKLSAVPNNDVDAYSFVTTLGTEFTEWLPLLVNNGLNEAKAAVTRNYYAVDIVGNISDPLTVVYSYTDANHQATDIKLIKDYDNDTGIQSDAKALIDADIANGTIKLAQIVNNNGTWFFNDGFLLLECTLKKKADSDNNDIPTKVELRDIWGGDWANYAIRGYASQANNTNGNLVFKVYPSNHTVSEGTTSSGRYYCYIAFKVGGDVGPDDNNKVWSFDGFYNNDQWGGSQLYAKIFGKSNAESDAISLNPEVVGADNKPRWKRDTTGPEITGTYLGTQGSANNVTKYTPSGTISIVYDKDKANSWTGKSNSYSSGLTIKIPAAGILDGITYSGDSGSVNNGQFVNYSGVAQYRTLVTGTDGADSDWQSLVPSDDGYYTIPVPDVTSVHSEIKLWIRDSVGNTSKEYKIGGPTDANSAWWILNNCLTEGGTTVTAPSAGWIADTDSVFDVTPPAGSIIKSVTAKVGNTDLTVKGISFNDYNGAPTVKINNVQTQVPMSDGWLNLSGLKVTVAPIAQGWDPKSVTIILNGTVSETVEFVPAKKLSSDDITLTKPTWAAGQNQPTYNVGITMNNGAALDKLDNMNFEAYIGDTKKENITVTFDKENSKFTVQGEGIPEAKTWTNQNIKIKISGDNIVEGGITLDAMTIPAISADDIEIKQIATVNGATQESDLNWSLATVDATTGERTFNLKFYCPTAIPEGTTITTNSVGSISNFDVANQTATFKVNKKWDTQTLKISIGDVVTNDLLIVPAIEAADISISSSPADWASGTTDYTITVGVKGDVTLTKDDFTATSNDNNATIKSNSWDATNSTIVINPANQSWNRNKAVSLKIHGIGKDVYTIPMRKLKSDNIKWGTIPSWNSSATSYDIPVSDMNKVTGDPSKPDIGLLNDIEVTVSINGTVNSSITGAYDSTNKKFTISGAALKNKDWTAQTVSINISGEHIDGTITKEIFTISAKKITGSDVTFTLADWVTGHTTDTEYTIKVALNGDNPPPIATFAAGLTVKQGSTTLTASWVKDDGGAYVLDDGKYQLKLKKFSVTQSWSEQNISVKVTGTNIDGTLEPEVLKVPAKKAADYITVTPTNPTAWAENTTSVKFTVAKSDNNLTISKVLRGETELTKGNDNAYTITAADGSSIPQDVTVTIKTNHGDVTKRIFPVSGTSNRFFGRSADTSFARDIFAHTETPGAVAALQTRIVSLPQTVQKVWETYTDTTDEIAAVASAVTQKASEIQTPKQSTKKSSKKAAKSAAPAAASAVAETVAQVVDSLETTELPVEALVEPAGEDPLAMLLPKTANPKPVVEPQASINIESTTSAIIEEEPEAPSRAILWILLCVFCTAVAGVVIIGKKRRNV